MIYFRSNYLSNMYLNDIDENIVSEITETRKSVYNQSYKYIKKKVSNDTVKSYSFYT